MIDNQNIPEIVYKYLDFETGIEKVLKEKTIKFSTPSSFNDPFDCYERLLKPSLGFYKKDFENEEFLLTILYKELEEGFERVLKRSKEESWITSFSKKYDIIMMWSHYAEKHSGVSIGFSTNNNTYFSEVNYTTELERKEFGPNLSEKEIEKAIEYMFSTKHIDWKYEKEIRCLNPDQKEYMSFSERSIKEIIFGLKVPFEKVKNKIKELHLYGYESVNFYQMKEVPNEFRIEKELINTEDIL